MASCDSSGACHVWSSASGARLCCFAEPGNPTVQASHSSSAWGRQHSAGKQTFSIRAPACSGVCGTPSEWTCSSLLMWPTSPSMFHGQSGIPLPWHLRYSYRGLLCDMTGRRSRHSSQGELDMQPLSVAPTAPASEALSSTQQMQPSGETPSLSAASVPPAAPVTQGLNTRSSAAYTCVAPAQRGWADGLVAGTASGRLRWLDLERGCSCADVYCHPISRWQVRGVLLVTSHICYTHGSRSSS